MIYLSDPYAFRSSRPSDAVQAVAVALEPVPAVAGVTPQAVGEWLNMDASEVAAESDFLQRLLDASVERCMQASGYVPAPMAFEFRWDVLPENVRGRGGVGPVFGEVSPWAELPRRPLSEVTAVTLDGEQSQDFMVDSSSNPPRVALPFAAAFERGFARLRVTANMGDATPDPRFVQAVLQLTAYVYDHRGCDISGAMRKSGAQAILAPLRSYHGGL